MRGGRTVGGEEVDKGGLVLFADTLQVEDFAEVGVGFVGDVDQIRLHERFWRRGADLQRFEEGVDFAHALVDAFGEAVCVISGMFSQ